MSDRCVDVVAVAGPCAAERHAYASRIADATGRTLLPVHPEADAFVESALASGRATHPRNVVLELSDTEPVSDTVAAAAADPFLRLSQIVWVAGFDHLRGDLLSPDAAATAGARTAESVLMTARQLEFASTIVLHGSTDCPTQELSLLLALVSHLNPCAELRLTRGTALCLPRLAGPPYAADQDRAGWVRLLNGEFRPRLTDPHVRAVRYQQLRPFHPARLDAALDALGDRDRFGTIVRSAGFCRFATRPGRSAHWSQVASLVDLVSLPADELLDEPVAFGQDLGIIGVDLDVVAVAAALDAAALTDEELLAGPGAWAAFADPLPLWPAVEEHD